MEGVAISTRMGVPAGSLAPSGDTISRPRVATIRSPGRFASEQIPELVRPTSTVPTPKARRVPLVGLSPVPLPPAGAISVVALAGVGADAADGAETVGVEVLTGSGAGVGAGADRGADGLASRGRGAGALRSGPVPEATDCTLFPAALVAVSPSDGIWPGGADAVARVRSRDNRESATDTDSVRSQPPSSSKSGVSSSAAGWRAAFATDRRRALISREDGYILYLRCVMMLTIL
jgi:hypothetical protein